LAARRGEAGQPEEGLKRLAEAAELAEETEDCWAAAEMRRLRGMLLLPRTSTTLLKTASTRCSLWLGKFCGLRAGTDLARLCRDQGKWQLATSSHQSIAGSRKARHAGPARRQGAARPFCRVASIRSVSQSCGSSACLILMLPSSQACTISRAYAPSDSRCNCMLWRKYRLIAIPRP